MELISEIKEQVNLINEVLVNLQKPMLLENQDFVLDEISAERYLKVEYVSLNNINFTIKISPFGTRIDIDRAMEIYDVEKRYLDSNKPEYKKFFLILLTSKIKVEYCGSNYTKILFFDESGTCVKTLKYISGLYLKIGCKTKEYPPIY